MCLKNLSESRIHSQTSRVKSKSKDLKCPVTEERVACRKEKFIAANIMMWWTGGSGTSL